MTSKKTFWLSYDLGLRGDYNSLYSWLDENKAKECGDNLAVFEYESKTENPREEIQNALSKIVEFNKSDRIYLIWRDDKSNLNKGMFIFGKRKQAPWEGYSKVEIEQSIDF